MDEEETENLKFDLDNLNDMDQLQQGERKLMNACHWIPKERNCI